MYIVSIYWMISIKIQSSYKVHVYEMETARRKPNSSWPLLSAYKPGTVPGALDSTFSKPHNKWPQHSEVVKLLFYWRGNGDRENLPQGHLAGKWQRQNPSPDLIERPFTRKWSLKVFFFFFDCLHPPIEKQTYKIMQRTIIFKNHPYTWVCILCLCIIYYMCTLINKVSLCYTNIYWANCQTFTKREI